MSRYNIRYTHTDKSADEKKEDGIFPCYYTKEFHSIRQQEPAFWYPTMNEGTHAHDRTYSLLILRLVPVHKVDDITRAELLPTPWARYKSEIVHFMIPQ